MIAGVCNSVNGVDGSAARRGGASGLLFVDRVNEPGLELESRVL